MDVQENMKERLLTLCQRMARRKSTGQKKRTLLQLSEMLGTLEMCIRDRGSAICGKCPTVKAWPCSILPGKLLLMRLFLTHSRILDLFCFH